ncbi:squalene synthase HpnC [Herminiimonas fonticola]|uniref:Squalene synthase HpnC n=1 Tax=Herminiimonas fonticola TaxID=303380 RepID=A0A4R6G3A0_9BURK|nr:squalene synthase HpnC [Herminiimonas fonticola]RBA23445.1 HpnC: squalene synthase HpnC [Herminiimonas fonticola]TDN88300.1 squalene synthase HpnC [Herminiimonas fonticola]
MAVDHYENFPVASILLPARLRPAVEVIYAFARSADDLADEGDASADERLAALSAYEDGLDQIAAASTPSTVLFTDLAKVIAEYQLPLQPFRDLLSAFKQDVVTTRYADFTALLDYCRRSANPVGTLMLHLYGAASEENLRDSNDICSALQLINFWQDVAVDMQKARIYLPLTDMQQFMVTEEHITAQRIDDAWRKLMQFEVDRARSMLLSGAPLALRLPGRIGWELRLVVQGGLRILECIEAVDYDVFQRRPKLGKCDWILLIWRAINMKAGAAPDSSK